MEIVVSSRHQHVSNETKQYVAEKIDAILENKTIKITSVKVVLDQQKNRYMAEVIVNAKNVDFEADAETFELYESIDTAVDKIDSQLSRYLDKKQDHHNKHQSIKDIPEKDEEEA